MSRSEREATVSARLRLSIVYSCPECGEQVEREVATRRHWIFDAPVASEVCPHCHAGLELLKPDVETLPDALAPLAPEFDPIEIEEAE